MQVTRRFAGSVGALALLAGMPSHAEEPAVLWYRSAEGCPDPGAFVRLLGDEASLVRLARAGDHIDFVVTFIAGDGTVSGRLERQTDAGTVAIREIDDAACDSVAGVLALGLQLALRGSEGPTANPPTEGTASAIGAPEIAVDAAAETAAPDAASPSETAPGAPPDAATTPSNDAADGPTAPDVSPAHLDPSRTDWSLESLGGMTTEQIDRPAGFVGAFLNLQGLRGEPFRRAARVGVLGSFAVRSTAEGPIEHGFLAARVDGCPLLLGSASVELWPCLAGEIGGVRARGARADGVTAGGVWVAVGADLSLRWRLTPGLGLAAGGGLVVPLSLYSLTAGDRELYATARAGERLWAGAFFPLP